MGSAAVTAERHQLRVDVVKIRTPSADLHVDVLRVVGYQGSCPCGWRSTTLKTYAEARIASRAHLALQDA